MRARTPEGRFRGSRRPSKKRYWTGRGRQAQGEAAGGVRVEGGGECSRGAGWVDGAAVAAVVVGRILFSKVSEDHAGDGPPVAGQRMDPAQDSVGVLVAEGGGVGAQLASREELLRCPRSGAARRLESSRGLRWSRGRAAR